MKRLGLIISLFLLVVLSAPPEVWAIAGPLDNCPQAPDNTQINTAIGCIPTDFGGLLGEFFTFGTGIGGGIAFLLILFGGFQILTSAGNPEQLNAGKELVVSAISGLLMIIFSVFLLSVIGVDILGLPDFTR